jgi:poly[(R)-3-hydroxyalkanoate] polymerase subunit PhaC
MTTELKNISQSKEMRHKAILDLPLHAGIAQLTAGISPIALAQAYTDWFQHLLFSPDKQIDIIEKAIHQWSRYHEYCPRACGDPHCKVCIEPLPQDKRFKGEAWQDWPYNGIYQGFLLTQQWWHNAMTNVDGVSKHHEDIVSFVSRQLLDMYSPANFLPTNPEVIDATIKQAGANLVRGTVNFWQDWQKVINNEKPVGTEAFVVGRNIAITPGKVVFRNHLIELIQYAPATDKVHPEPVLIIPAWIMKYYILDLSLENSMVKYLVDNGYTVFMISWKNPGSEDRDLGMEDYRRLGVMAALDAISTIVPKHPIHAVGYCLGGTLLAIVAAALARNADDRLKTLTLLASQTDFTEAGELMLFIDDAQISFIEHMMAEQGYLDTSQMVGAFQLLRSNDLIWSKMVRNYLMGERRPMIDLMAWNADATRMPYRMHSEYLRQLFLNNDLAEGRYCVDDHPVSLRDIRLPIFAVSTVADHVAPWRSVYKIQALTNADVTFVLSNGGHNAGIVSPPEHPNRHHQIATHDDLDAYVDPDAWQKQASHHEGSWWPCWQKWLNGNSGDLVKPAKIGSSRKGYKTLCDAPGTYVMEK